MSGNVEKKIAELGLTLPTVPAPVAAYVPAVRSGDFVYTSGQLPFVNGSLPETGKVGTEAAAAGVVSPERATELAGIAVLNAVAALGSIVDLDQVERIVKVVGFVASDPTFTGQPGVVNGASELVGQIFGDAGAHARSAVGVAVLPLDSPVEIELIAKIKG